MPRLLRRRVLLPHSWSQLKTDCPASGIITDNTPPTWTWRHHIMHILIFHGLTHSIVPGKGRYSLNWEKGEFYKKKFFLREFGENSKINSPVNDKTHSEIDRDGR